MPSSLLLEGQRPFPSDDGRPLWALTPGQALQWLCEDLWQPWLLLSGRASCLRNRRRQLPGLCGAHAGPCWSPGHREDTHHVRAPRRAMTRE